MATHKHLCDDPADLVLDSLRGLSIFNPAARLDEEHKVLYTPKRDPKRVSIICGGGSGHEPSHAGFVGDGMLSAAVCGNIYASPNAAQIRRAIDLVGSKDTGCVIIVKNYTGDVLNFGLASEQSKSATAAGTPDVRVVVVGDDVAVGRTQGGIVGRRGLAGTVLVYKIAAALAARQAKLDEVESLAKWLAENVGTIAVGFEHCHVPGTARSGSHLKPDEVELGMGIHNEPGHQRLHPMPRLQELVDNMMRMLTSTTDPERSFLPFKHDGQDKVVLLINNLGGVSELEMGAVTNRAYEWLVQRQITVARILAGTFMTSLNMPGVSITLLLLPRDLLERGLDANGVIALLDEPTSAPGWKWYSKSEPVGPRSQGEKGLRDTAVSQSQAHDLVLRPSDQHEFLDALKRMAEAVISAEPEITEYDRVGGDGDAGLTLKAGAEGVLSALKTGHVQGYNAIDDLGVVGRVIEGKMGGTSGALYSIFFTSLVKALRDAAHAGSESTTPPIWAKAADQALETLMKYTKARPPSRTLIDPLSAFVHGLHKGLTVAIDAAKKAAEETRKLEATAGRAAYVDQKQLVESGTPDPGAWGVYVLAQALGST